MQQVERHADWWAAAEEPLCADSQGWAVEKPHLSVQQVKFLALQNTASILTANQKKTSTELMAWFLRVPLLLNGTSVNNTRSQLLDKWLEKLSSKSADFVFMGNECDRETATWADRATRQPFGSNFGKYSYLLRFIWVNLNHRSVCTIPSSVGAVTKRILAVFWFGVLVNSRLPF